MKNKPNYKQWILTGIVLGLAALAKEFLVRQEVAPIYLSMIEMAEVFPECHLAWELTAWLWNKFFPDPNARTDGWQERWVKTDET